MFIFFHFLVEVVKYMLTTMPPSLLTLHFTKKCIIWIHFYWTCVRIVQPLDASSIHAIYMLILFPKGSICVHLISYCGVCAPVKHLFNGNYMLLFLPKWIHTSKVMFYFCSGNSIEQIGTAAIFKPEGMVVTNKNSSRRRQWSQNDEVF